MAIKLLDGYRSTPYRCSETEEIVIFHTDDRQRYPSFVITTSAIERTRP